MKKRLISVILLSTLVLLCACGSSSSKPEVTPSKTVDQFLKGIQDEDQDAIKKVYEESTFDLGAEVWDDDDDEEGMDTAMNKVLTDDFYPRLIDFEYKIGEEEINGDEATVKVDITTYKMGDAFVAGFKDFFAGAMDLYNSNASDEQVSKVMSEKLHRQISALKKKEYKKTATFHLTKEKGVWVVEDMDDDNNEAALNILSGGMLDAENSIDRMTDD